MSPPLLCPPVEKADNENGGPKQHMSSELKANFATLKKRKMDEPSAQKVAEETAYLLQSEIQQMRNSVAELEAMLAAREAAEGDEDFDSGDEDDDDDKVDDLPAKNPFPLLLPDVIAIPDSGFVGFDDDDDDFESEAEEEGGKTEG